MYVVSDSATTIGLNKKQILNRFGYYHQTLQMSSQFYLDENDTFDISGQEPISGQVIFQGNATIIILPSQKQFTLPVEEIASGIRHLISFWLFFLQKVFLRLPGNCYPFALCPLSLRYRSRLPKQQQQNKRTPNSWQKMAGSKVAEG